MPTIWILTLIVVFLFCFQVFSYDTKVGHTNLTREAAKFYNSHFDPDLSEEEIAWLVKGAIEEDSPPRWLNHYYDPVHNKGLWNNPSAKEWANLSDKQRFFAQGDQTWQKAIKEYKEGDKKKAFIALGHILHLIEDMAVPAHTRLDPHPEGDPYETWVKENFQKQFLQIQKEIKNRKPINYNELNQYFDGMAGYSSRYFYSKDTIEDKRYESPVIVEKREEIVEGQIFIYNYVEDTDGTNFPLFVSINKKEWHEIFKPTFFLDKKIHSAYFIRLVPQAIIHSAGVIRLFQEEAKSSEKREEKKEKFELRKMTKEEKEREIGGYILGKRKEKLGWWQSVWDEMQKFWKIIWFWKDEEAKQEWEELVKEHEEKGLMGLMPEKVNQEPSQESMLRNQEKERDKNQEKHENIITSKHENIETEQESKKQNSEESSFSHSPEKKTTEAKGENQKSGIKNQRKESEEIKDENRKEEEIIDKSNETLRTPQIFPIFPAPLAFPQLLPFPGYAHGGRESGEQREKEVGAQEITAQINYPADGLTLNASSDINLGLSSIQIIITGQATPLSELEIKNVQTSQTLTFTASAVTSAANNFGRWQTEMNLTEGRNEIKLSAKINNQFIQKDQINLFLDSLTPSSSLIFLAPIQTANTSFYLTWTAFETLTEPADSAYPVNYSGLDEISFQYQEKNNQTLTQTAWTDFYLTQIAQTDQPLTQASGQILFQAKNHHTYFFRTRSKDRAGNQEPWPETPQTETIVSIPAQPPSPYANYVVISEIQISGATAEDEFVELYNPTENDISLNNWALKRKTQSGINEYYLVSPSSFRGTIPSHGFFLIAHPTGYDKLSTGVEPDLTYSSASYSLTKHNTVLLYNNQGEIVDKVGYGSALDSEIAPAVFPDSDFKAQLFLISQSIERKAKETSTSDTMFYLDGTDSDSGNAYDTNNNSRDFILTYQSYPQNSLSRKEKHP